MALHLKVSNILKNLASHLCDLVEQTQEQQQVFRPVYIVTQTDGMNNWLKHQIAERLGIAANYRYVKPHELINQVYFLLGGQSLEVLSNENLQWLIYGLLADASFITRFPVVSEYYNKETADKDLKRMTLAEKIADLFDQYQVYRPEMVEKWNQTKEEDEITEWQQYLWVRAKQLLSNRLPDKTITRQYIIGEMQKPGQQQRLVSRMPVIYLFGLSITTAYHIQLYNVLGKFTDLVFFMLNPSPHVYWFEDKSPKLLVRLRDKKYKNAEEQQPGNTLLTSWGRILQDTYSLLFENETLINAYQEVGVEEPSGKTLLKKIQRDIYYSNTVHPEVSKEDLTDGSLVISSCYSPVREVEVLYNYLVQLVEEQKGGLSPRDIVVMMSDVETYAPYIKAIFDNAPYKFRYSIADDKYTSGDTVSAALSALLLITEEDFTSEKVVQLLDLSFIRKRFRLTDLGMIRDVVNKANIRFGIDNNTEDDSMYVSWKYGLQRIMYGICVSGEDEFGSGPESFYPIDVVEGGASEQLIRFTHFVEILIGSLYERKERKTLAGWVSYVQQLIDNMVCEPEEAVDEGYQMIQKHLETYNAIEGVFTEKITYQVFSHNLLQSLHTSTRSGSFAAGGITFCSLIPMRSIPFKVVALLGLNFDKFPRKDNTLSFNLMEGNRQKGDRSTKENDKHLFLETILSAQDYLYISYVGKSVKDNTVIPPSALIDELLDYIVSGAKDVSSPMEWLVTKHPLHGFSHKYNQPGDKQGLKSYLQGEAKNAQELILKNKENDPLSFDEISLHAFINFFKNPIKGYYNNVLKIFYKDEDSLLEENEVFELDKLQQWSLKHQLLLMDAEETKAIKDKLVKTGRLPLKFMADVSLNDLEDQVIDTRTLFRNIIGETPATTVPVEVQLHTTKLKGSLTIYKDKMVVVSFSKNECKYLLEAYIQYLAALASGLQVQLIFISAHKNEAHCGTPLSAFEAKSSLEALVQLYKDGHQNILAFYPQFKIDPHSVDVLDTKAFLKALKGVVENFNAPCTDGYILKEWSNKFYDKGHILDWYKSNCQLLLKPLAEIFPTYYPPVKTKKSTKNETATIV